MTNPTDPGPATLGRFVPSAGASLLVEVHLLGVPLHVMRDSREHHDGLMREFRLLALSGQDEEDDLPRRLVQLVQILGEQYGTRRERRDAELEAAMAAGREVVDLVELVPAAASAGVVHVGALLDEADSYCRQALLMTLPRPALLRRFGDWYLGQFVDQLAGGPAVRWDGPLRAEV